MLVLGRTGVDQASSIYNTGLLSYNINAIIGANVMETLTAAWVFPAVASTDTLSYELFIMKLNIFV